MASSRVAAPNPPNLSITSPLLHDKFYIAKDAVWPSVVFQTNAVLGSGEQVKWEWSIKWGRFFSLGVVSTDTSWWDAQPAITNLGGVLTVVAGCGTASTASTSVQILGTQPEQDDVLSYLASKQDSLGFDKILKHESAMKHFDESGNPARSFDNGYGMAQLTNPAPSYEQVWNWKLNVEGGLSLFGQKRAQAVAYLSRKGKFAESQLVHETVSRWNGGSYHIWDAQQGWIRKPIILCDSKTGNIGWNMTEGANKGKTEEELHKRDCSCYSRPPGGDDKWGYFGVCYADSVLGV